MPRRRNVSRSGPAKPRRDYAAEYARRQARARAAGFRSYYEQRTRRAPGAEKPPPDVLRRRRGHAGPADLRRDAGAGDQLTAQLTRRDDQGRYRRIEIAVDSPDGTTTTYRLHGRQLRKDFLLRLVRDLEAAGVTFSPAPSQDLRRLARGASE